MAKIDFVISRFPERTYNTNIESNLYKFLSSLTPELDIFLSEMNKVKQSKFINTANDNDLDKLASMLNMKRFHNENMEDFRGRIKARIPSFIGGGTIEAIKQVVVGYLGVEPTIIEHYKPDENIAQFDNGVFNGLNTELFDNNTIRIKSGVAYIEGKRFTINKTDLDISSSLNGLYYAYLDNSSNISLSNDSEYDSKHKILLSEVELLNGDAKITDKRFILDPYEHYITNTATISVQIPFEFIDSMITFENFKDILKSTRSAGIAMIIKKMDSMKDTLNIVEVLSFIFEIGFTGFGAPNTIGFDREWKTLNISENWENWKDYKWQDIGAANVRMV